MQPELQLLLEQRILYSMYLPGIVFCHVFCSLSISELFEIVQLQSH